MQPSAWHLMQDGVLFLTVNHQGGPRGGDELVSQNWWMGMAQRPFARGTLTFNLMLSAEPLTAGRDGYREIFQAGEALDHIAVIDRQHPHDFLVQAAAVWRVPVGRGYALTVAGAPVGEPALGPVAFMHRASAAEMPTAPLAHHTMDSTHIAMGVVTAGIDRGPWQIETSIFRGREPDDDRWDLMDPGALDSWSVRGWYRRAVVVPPALTRLPERAGGARAGRRAEDDRVGVVDRHARRGSTAATIAYGRNDKPGKDFNALVAEATHTFGANAVYGRFEAVQVETDLLRFGVHGFVGRKGAHVPEGNRRRRCGVGADARRHAEDRAVGGDGTPRLVRTRRSTRSPPCSSRRTARARCRSTSSSAFARRRRWARMIDVTMTRMMKSP